MVVVWMLSTCLLSKDFFLGSYSLETFHTAGILVSADTKR